MDISGKDNAAELRAASPYAYWLKPISVDKTIHVTEYDFINKFKRVAAIELDNEVNQATNRRKRQTVIRFNPIISPFDFAKKAEWIYLFAINDRIVKIGGTRTGIKSRTGSYLCGHHIPERGNSGDCSKTNGFIYNTFEFYLSIGCKIEMYGYEIPKAEILLDDVFGRTIRDGAQVFHIYESVALNAFHQKYGFNPILSDNADPEYRV